MKVTLMEKCPNPGEGGIPSFPTFLVIHKTPISAFFISQDSTFHPNITFCFGNLKIQSLNINTAFSSELQIGANYQSLYYILFLKKNQFRRVPNLAVIHKLLFSPTPCTPTIDQNARLVPLPLLPPPSLKCSKKWENIEKSW